MEIYRSIIEPLYCIVVFLYNLIIAAVHAYNIGVVEYDYKIVIVVIKLLGKEIKNLFVKETGPRQTKNQVNMNFYMEFLSPI